MLNVEMWQPNFEKFLLNVRERHFKLKHVMELKYYDAHTKLFGLCPSPPPFVDRLFII